MSEQTLDREKLLEWLDIGLLDKLKKQSKLGNGKCKADRTNSSQGSARLVDLG